MIIKDGDTDNDFEEENGVVARVRRQSGLPYQRSSLPAIYLLTSYEPSRFLGNNTAILKFSNVDPYKPFD